MPSSFSNVKGPNENSCSPLPPSVQQNSLLCNHSVFSNGATISPVTQANDVVVTQISSLLLTFYIQFIRKSYQSSSRIYPESHLFLPSPHHLSFCSHLSLPPVSSMALSHLPVPVLASIPLVVHPLHSRLSKM